MHYLIQHTVRFCQLDNSDGGRDCDDGFQAERHSKSALGSNAMHRPTTRHNSIVATNKTLEVGSSLVTIFPRKHSLA